MIRFTAMGILRAGVILVMVSVAFSAAAEDKEAAKKAFSEATRYYNLNQYADALEAFKRAYWNYEDPVFLYNIAQCHRLLKHKAEAIDFYKSYLRNAPNARNRVEVQRVVADLEASLQQDRALANAPPEGPIQSTNTPPSTTPPSTTPPATTETQPPPAAVVTTTAPGPSPRADKPLWKKAWFWGVVGGAAVVVAGVAIGVGIATSTPKDPSASLGARPVN
jgi:tetratricopeptide (TPR) repeat protein